MNEDEILRYWLLTARDLIRVADQVPYRPGFLGSLGLTTFTPITTTTVQVVQRDQQSLALIQTTERGGPIEQDLPRGANVKVLPTFRLAKGATIRSHEVQDVVMFGEPGGQAIRERVGAELTRRFSEIELDMSLTEEHMLLSMVQGSLIDADGTPLQNFYTEFGITPKATETFDFATLTISTLRAKLNAFKRSIVQSLAGLPAVGTIDVLCGDAFYDALVTSAAVKEIYETHAGARELENIGQAYGMFPFAGFRWWNYRGTDDGTTIAIADDEAKFFPRGVPGLFLDVRAPGEDLSNVNRRGRRRYPLLVRDPQRNFWLKQELYTYPNYICTRPDVLRTGALV